jgi:hypothetical protein
MKRRLLLFAAMAAMTLNMKAQPMNAAGAAYHGPSGTLNLVPGPYGSAYVSGAGWSTNPVDFTKSFSVEFDARFTIRHNNGADGFVLVFGNYINTAVGGSVGGFVGGHMGYYMNNPTWDFNNSMGVEFDVFDNGANLNDVLMPGSYYADHIMVARDAGFLSAGTIAGPSPILAGGTTIQDAAFHHYRIDWNCVNSLLRVYVDQHLRLATTIPDVLASSSNPIFSNPASVSWGFTGAREFSASQIKLKNIVMHQWDKCEKCLFPQMDVEFAGCNPDGTNTYYVNLLPGAFGGTTSWHIDFGDGTTATVPQAFQHLYSPGAYKITLTVSGTGEFKERCTDVVSTYIYVPDCYGLEPDDDAQHKMSPTHLDELETSAKAVYPNPANGEITVSTTSKFNNINIIDITGKTVVSKSYNEENISRIDVSRLPAGVYTIMVGTATGEQIREKLVIE